MSVHTTTTVTPSVEEDVSTSEVLPDDSTILPMHTESEAMKDGGTEDMNASYAGTTMIALVSSDQITFPISKAAAKLSGLIVDTLSWDDEEDDDDSNQVEYEPIYLPRVEGDCLQKVVDFLNHSAIDPLPKIQQPLVGNSLHEVRRRIERRELVFHGTYFKIMVIL
jgi:Skp1 family, tetramerisation domain